MSAKLDFFSPVVPPWLESDAASEVGAGAGVECGAEPDVGAGVDDDPAAGFWVVALLDGTGVERAPTCEELLPSRFETLLTSTCESLCDGAGALVLGDELEAGGDELELAVSVLLHVPFGSHE